MKSKILFLSINTRFTHSCLALYYLRAMIKETDYQTEILEMTIHEPLEDILKAIYLYKPDYLVFSVYIWNRTKFQMIGKNIKKILPELKILCGGPELSWDSEDQQIDFSFSDYIIRGAGEKAFVNLVKSGFNNQERIIHEDNYSINSIPFPYKSEDMIDLNHKYVYYESSRGCPFLCSYCLSSRSDQRLEYRDIEKVKAELLFFIQHKVPIVKFVDRSFNVNQRFAREVWQFLIENYSVTKFHFEIHPSYLENEDFEILKKTPENLFQFEIGVQSIHDHTLQAIHRDVHWQDIKFKIQEIINIRNIHVHLDQIAGLPFEDYTQIKESFNEIINLFPDHYQPGLLKVLKGTALYVNKETYHLVYSEEAPYQLLCNQWLSYEELNEYLEVETVVDIIYNSKLFSYLIKILPTLTRDYYSIFLAISKEFINKGISKNIKDRYKLFEIVSELLPKIFPLNEDLILDALCFDWALSNQTHSYPDFLKAEQSDKNKTENWLRLKKIGVRGIYSLEGHELTLNELRKSSFFKARSDSFSDYFKLSNQGWLIVNSRTIISLTDLGE